MKSNLLLALAGIGALFSARTPAQTYILDWFTLDGGGGTSRGGAYAATGTIGQPDAGRMSGGQYSLIGGFWGVVDVIQTHGAPRLNIERTAGGVRIFWERPATGWVLEESTALQSAPAAIAWSLVPPASYLSDATHFFITVPATTGHKFYRLHRTGP
jgi:hypothetical protein